MQWPLILFAIVASAEGTMAAKPILGDITEQEAALLTALRKAKISMSLDDARKASGLTHRLFHPAQIALRERKLVDNDPHRGHANIVLLRITTLGKRHLTAYMRAIEQAQATRPAIVPPPTYNTAGTDYVPSTTGYYRNSGNKHIKSVGVRC